MKKILVVEDNPSNRYLITYILEKNGFEVITADTGEEGVQKATKESFDLVLMDIQLPGIDGFEATRQIRASGTDGTLPIIALTSYAMVGDREKAISMGCTGYIEKPINPDTIIAEILEHL
ncbi:response regulator [Methanoplanus endosymbiosus]|uniref:Response regulator n=1 Tax=Methanoplanus endosymbiosus TaxID=33865 RepID=A0A9E7PN34_9EURY|nr:response regulator [Methanoplanus endosymbiosus]UUX93289.1 response regulator [Methanoplanus endosymbiosus]